MTLPDSGPNETSLISCVARAPQSRWSPKKQGLLLVSLVSCCEVDVGCCGLAYEELVFVGEVSYFFGGASCPKLARFDDGSSQDEAASGDHGILLDDGEVHETGLHAHESIILQGACVQKSRVPNCAAFSYDRGIRSSTQLRRPHVDHAVVLDVRALAYLDIALVA